MPRRPAKQRTVAEWQISRVAKKAVYLGKVEATGATAIKAAIKRYDTGWTKAARERGAEFDCSAYQREGANSSPNDQARAGSRRNVTACNRTLPQRTRHPYNSGLRMERGPGCARDTAAE